MPDVERLTRPRRGAPEAERRAFGKRLLESLDLLGVAPGQDFVMAPAPLSAADAPDALFHAPRTGTGHYEVG